MRPHIEPRDVHEEACRGVGSLKQRYGFIKADSRCVHRSLRWQANTESGPVDNDVTNVGVTGWKGH